LESGSSSSAARTDASIDEECRSAYRVEKVRVEVSGQVAEDRGVPCLSGPKPLESFEAGADVKRGSLAFHNSTASPIGMSA
jgi:hypothetical protein